MYLPDRPCRNQCEVKSGQRFRKSGAWRSVFNDRSGLSGQNGRKQGSGKDSGMIAVLSMEEALERANWLLGKKMVLHFGGNK